MTYRSLLIHTCTRQRAAEIQTPDNEIYRDWANADEVQLACRYTQNTERYGNEQEGFVILTESVLFLLPGADVTTEDRIANIVDASGATVEPGPFDVLEVNPKYNGSSLHHYELGLEKAE